MGKYGTGAFDFSVEMVSARHIIDFPKQFWAREPYKICELKTNYF
jgi:hypothetical protein